MTREEEIRDRLREPIGPGLSDAGVGALADELGVLHHHAEGTRVAVRDIIRRVEALERASVADMPRPLGPDFILGEAASAKVTARIRAALEARAEASTPGPAEAVVEAARAIIRRLDAGPPGPFPYGPLRAALAAYDASAHNNPLPPPGGYAERVERQSAQIASLNRYIAQMEVEMTALRAKAAPREPAPKPVGEEEMIAWIEEVTLLPPQARGPLARALLSRFTIARKEG